MAIDVMTVNGWSGSGDHRYCHKLESCHSAQLQLDQQQMRVMMITKLDRIMTTSHIWKQWVSLLLFPGEKQRNLLLRSALVPLQGEPHVKSLYKMQYFLYPLWSSRSAGQRVEGSPFSQGRRFSSLHYHSRKILY